MTSAPVNDATARRFTIFLSSLALVSNTICSLALSQLPPDAFHLTQNFALYSGFAAILSGLGLIGAIKRNSSLVLIFSNHLLLDAFLSTLPRILLSTLLFSLPSNLCSLVELHRRSPGQPAEAFPNTWTFESWSPRQCHVAMWVVQAVAVALTVALTVVQWVGAIRVRRFGKALEVEQVCAPVAAGEKLKQDVYPVDLERRGSWSDKC